MKNAITSSKIFDGEHLINNHALLLDGSTIVDLVSIGDVPKDYPIEHCADGILAPGFIDWQVNGGGGALLNNAINKDTISTIVHGHHKGGTSSLLPTLISDAPETMRLAVSAVKSAIASGNESVLGLHIEGPFFANERRGVHDQDSLRKLTNQDVDWLCSIADISVVITLAPEQTELGQIKALAQAGVIVSAGHSNADGARVQLALDEGLRGFTHLYNAMSSVTAREPGMVGSALADEHSWCGIIVDGHHVSDTCVRLAQAAKPNGKICLVTDAMATVGSDQTEFELYGETIKQQDGCLVNHEGRLAGSAISMIDAVRISHKQVGIELIECLRMASLYPAQFLRVDTFLGKLKSGYRADLVHFNDDFKVTQTWVAGQPKLT